MQQLQEHAEAWNMEISAEQQRQFTIYEELLLEWNKVMNLTAITSHQEILIKHFLDSVLVLNYVKIPRDSSLVDVGTGAGFPGIPLRIMRPDLRLTLLDSLQKRVGFLSTVSDRLGHDGTRCVHGRAEELGRDKEYRERFDFACARAVASLPALSEYCLPFVRVGGCFMAMKGWDVDEELEGAGPAIRQLGGEVEQVNKLELPQGNRRSIILIKKISPTPPKFPRKGVKISKSPLT